MSMAGTTVHEYRVERFLGQGAYAEVYLCSKTDEGGVKQYAAKVFNKSILRKSKNWRKVGGKMVFDTALTEVEREIALMKKIRHPRIVKLYEVVDDPEQGKLYMFLEFMSGGELMSWEESAGRFTAREVCGEDVMDHDTARRYFRDLIEAIAFLHAHKIVHRDIKPMNLLVSAKGKVKLADFGVAHVFEDQTASKRDFAKAGFLTNTKGTAAFMAPEMLVGGAFSAYQADVWAMGVTLYAMVTGCLPFYAPSEMEVMDMIEEEDVPFPDSIDGALRNVLARLLDKDPATRITVDELRSDPWVCEGGLSPVPPPAAHLVRSVSHDEIKGAITFMATVRIQLKLLRAAAMARERVRQRASQSGSRPGTPHSPSASPGPRDAVALDGVELAVTEGVQAAEPPSSASSGASTSMPMLARQLTEGAVASDADITPPMLARQLTEGAGVSDAGPAPAPAAAPLGSASDAALAPPSLARQLTEGAGVSDSGLAPPAMARQLTGGAGTAAEGSASQALLASRDSPAASPTPSPAPGAQPGSSTRSVETTASPAASSLARYETDGSVTSGQVVHADSEVRPPQGASRAEARRFSVDPVDAEE
eukprot:CAMPEP_0196777240 /NCGR_PEP_ID=MMETSP1104-20130614/5106_1 /TAXON_ID=33652 /ORGANISM="Cafeteria sp., Strain Caron Lab Isolate" /LENGTH=592 /DNA_ID=CAMNT_0042147407 /DNA_START=147 /DNA_END=1922 /DNA_ORIENTATION=-